MIEDVGMIKPKKYKTKIGVDPGGGLMGLQPLLII